MSKDNCFSLILGISTTAILCLVGCPFYRVFHLPCPTCGVTRAWVSALQGQFLAAFRYHLFFPVIPFVLPLAWGLAKPTRRIAGGMILFAVLLSLYNGLRLLSIINMPNGL